MTNLKHLKGDLFTFAEAGLFDAVIHGCNAQGVMGSGIAKTVKTKYPGAFEVYRNSKMLPGTWSVWFGPKFGIINAITQDRYLPRGKDHFEYDAFKDILESLLLTFPDRDWGIPYIGMGLAGGDSSRILDILEDFASKVSDTQGSVTLVEYDG